MRKNNKNDNVTTFAENVVPFIKDDVTMNEVADEYLDENDVESALSVYLDLEKQGKGDYVLFRKIADLYTELEMFEYSINYWFKFLDAAPAHCRAEAYNGLGGNYFFLHDNQIAAYYFNLQINDKGDADFPFDDMMYELFSADDFAPADGTPKIRLVDKNEDRDRKIVERARSEAENMTEKTENDLWLIESDSKYYGEAQYLLGALLIFRLDFDDAAECYYNAKKHDAYADIALTNVFSLALFTGDDELREKAFDELKTEDCVDFETAIKFFSLYAGFERHDLAYEYAKKLKELLPRSGKLHLYYAYAAFNAGDYETAEREFNAYYKISGAEFAVFNAKAAKNAIGRKTPPKKMEYANSLQRSEGIKQLEKLYDALHAMISGQKKKGLDVFGLIKTSLSTDNPEVHAFCFNLLRVINDEKSVAIMKDYLLADNVFDNIKSYVMMMLVEMGYEEPAGLVSDHIYSKIPFEHVEFDGSGGDMFREAYAFAFGRIAPYCEKEMYKLRVSAYEIFDKITANGNIGKIKKTEVLAALMVRHAKLNGLKVNDDALCKYFNTTKLSVNKIELLMSENNESENY